GIPYRYGFEVSGKKIHSEWLFYTPKTEEVELFTRSNLEVKVNPRHFKEGSDKKNTNLYSTSSLFFSVVSSFNGEKSKKIESYFKTITIISGLNDGIWGRKTISFLEDSSYQVKILKLLELADTGIKSIQRLEINRENIPNSVSEDLQRVVKEGFKIESALTSRTFKDENGNTVSREFLLDQHESEGTKKLIAYSVPLIDSMKNPVILIIDEFDARFHPLITRKILQLFHSKELNIHNSQILIATHDVTLLKADILRRDQIYFAEKDQSHSTRYYSLSDFKGIRNDASFDKDYINGRYGAIPFLGNFEDFLKEHSNEAN
ncbi:MAG TPA: ATP-binding protein, partial [Leptospiraceae bacterium]|nr:ATP-binding protein [Leptospiraceae bacterium]